MRHALFAASMVRNDTAVWRELGTLVPVYPPPFPVANILTKRKPLIISIETGRALSSKTGRFHLGTQDDTADDGEWTVDLKHSTASSQAENCHTSTKPPASLFQANLRAVR